RPEEYLDAFTRFINENLNQIPALLAVKVRPRNLTRQDLRELSLKLEQAGFTELALRTAWRDTRNEDVAASIVGFIRQGALGSPLVP
ncbi:type I restriction-modification enzyme R subunit C-terminal domain-containing protein, partial [Streptomyces galilaeus]|uniref:type I restriction-modification enzyme R subunit C-terminal domain-containing protein n=1 Tax=Streptomyces galilaeus TaxID=33899 RepID=UPI0038F68E6A